MKEKAQALAQVAMKLGQAIYEKQQQAAGFARRRGGARGADEDVVDAEFSEVDEQQGVSLTVGPAAAIPARRAGRAAGGGLTGHDHRSRLLRTARMSSGPPTTATIKSSYRKLAMKYHPDKNAGCKDSEAKFKAISEAYDCLKDPQKRAAYDRFGHAAFQQGGGRRRRRRRAGFRRASATFSRTSSASSWAAAGGGGARQPRRGADLRYDMEITLEDAFHGKATDDHASTSRRPCDACDGTGAKPGTSAKTCQTCARPRQGARAAGLLRGRARPARPAMARAR